MKSAEYWAGRMERLNESMMQKADAMLPELEKAYLRAEESICREIEAFYQRYAGQEGITLAEAKRLLSPAERKRFGLTLEEYIKIGERVPVDPYWQSVLERTSVSVRISRLEALRLQICQQVELLEGWKDNAMTQTLGEIFRECFYQTGYEIQRGLGIGVAFATIDTKTIGKALAKPWAADGKTFSDRIWGEDRTKLLHSLETTLTTGIITGEDPGRIAAKMQKTMGVSQSAARRLVLTEGAAFSAMARQDCYAELGVGKYEFLATLDAKTCGICAAMDGQVFDLADYEIGVTAPPLHPNDRCTTVPHIEDEGLAIGERAARDGDGKTYYIPANMTYQEWKKAFVEGGTEGLTAVAKGGILTLPRYESAIMPEAKFAKYSLNPEKAPDKARAFKEALGYDLSNYEELMEDIRKHLAEYPAKQKSDLGYGMRYEVILTLKGPNGKTANVLTAWIDDSRNGEIRLTSVYVDKRKESL